MPDSLDTQQKPVSSRAGSADGQVFDHVEKWLAMIREINREQQDQTKHRS